MRNSSVRIGVIIVAGGKGARCQGCSAILPKQYALLNNIPVLAISVLKLLSIDIIRYLRVVIAHDDYELYQKASMHFIDPRVLPPVNGGFMRSNSVYNGLTSMVNLQLDYVLIHDACRPFVTKNLLMRIINKLGTSDGIAPAIPITDTLKAIDVTTQIPLNDVDRTCLRAIQTPQAFDFNILWTCYQKAHSMNLLDGTFTDDIGILDFFAKSVTLIDGEHQNFKITTNEDICRAKLISRSVLVQH